jgi:8-oxo-dGTP pyrophosphatase MutT (NUDIX family)
LLKAPPWVGVVCLTRDQELVLVRQYRHGHGGTSLELPAGVIDREEDIVVAARRELEEETGFEAEDMAPLWRVRPEPARHDQWAHFCLARGASRKRAQRLDDTEHIEVVTRPLGDLDDIISEMVHGPHVAALLLAERRGLLR